MHSQDILLCNPVRTAIGAYNGTLKGVPATELGATGAVLVTRLLHGMQRDGLRRGMVTLCIGGGQGIALALEAA
jgi:acetyl-CoA acetyltransferase